MAKLSEILSIVRNLPRGGQGDSIDNAYTDRELTFIINYYRAKLIEQDVNKGKYLTQFYAQTLGKVRLIKSSRIDCGLPDCDIGDSILRIENPLPKTIDTNDKNLITYVGAFDGSQAYQRTTFHTVKYDAYAKFTGGRTKYYELDKYLYIINPPTKNLKYITITGVFEDPLKVNEFKNTSCDDGDSCFDPFDIEYPLGLKYLDTIYKLMVSSEFRFNNILKFDTTNNSQDDNQLQK